ncbi:MAG: ATP-binding protein, partial [Spirochaetales bacterium]|nr:ATP-binding protein [Spirochaetales bacterium]
YMLENIIYLELIRRGKDVYIGKVGELEVDFITIGQSELSYIQVALTVRDNKTLERELRPLNKINDNYSKILITLDHSPPTTHNGIRQINAIDFLMGKES